jgi:glutathione peroxidase
MKYIFSILALSALFSFRFTADDIYNQPLKDIDGNTIQLSSYSDKKILFIILPVSGEDSAVTPAQLTKLANKYTDSLIIIGVAAEEWGYTIAIKTQVKALYSGQPSNFILAEGMKVKKASGEQQSPLFQWLTDKDRNKHFDREISGTGEKFFVDEGGTLYGVIGKNLQLSNPLTDRIVTKTRSTPQ